MTFPLSFRGFASAALLFGASCSNMMDTDLATQLVSIDPRGSTSGVSTSLDIVMSFSGPMMPGRDMYIRLHEGGPSGPQVTVSCAWSGDQRTMTCRPDETLLSNTHYVMHVGGGLVDANGRHVGMGRAGDNMGGRWITGSMMGTNMTCTGWGWMHENGSYGMAFEFTTR